MIPPGRARGDIDEGDRHSGPEPPELDDLAATRAADGREGLALSRLAALVLLIVCLSVVIFQIRAELRRSPHETLRRPASLVRGEPPAAAPAHGSYVSAHIRQDGTVEVTQWVRTVRPIEGIELKMPALMHGDATRLASAVVVAGMVGAQYYRVTGPTTVTEKPARYEFDVPVTLVQLRYTLEGVAELSPSEPGRALVAATSLTVSVGTEIGPTKTDLVGADILSAACVAPGASAPRPCGAPRADNRSWRVTLSSTRRDEQVQAQVQLG